MLINDFFKLISTTKNDGKIISTIQINASHQIFEGHFPNNPITPGVVQIQMVKEILQEALQQECLLKEVGRCKFLTILNPNEFPEIIVKIDYAINEDKTLKVSAQGTTINGNQTFFKFTAKYA